MVNLKTQIPSEVTGDVVSIQKGRSILSLNTDELQFLVNLATLLSFSSVTGVNPEPPEPVIRNTGRVITLVPTSAETVAA